MDLTYLYKDNVFLRPTGSDVNDVSVQQGRSGKKGHISHHEIHYNNDQEHKGEKGEVQPWSYMNGSACENINNR